MTSEQIDALWTIDDPNSGEAKLTEALKQNPDSADEIHTQLCRTLGLQLKFPEAWAELSKISTTPTPIVTVRVNLESGRLKNTSGDKPASKSFFLKALAEATYGNFDYYAVDAAHMLAIVTQGEESLEWNEKAIKMAIASNDPRAQKWQGSLLNNLGWTYHDMGNLNEALEKFKQAFAYRNWGDDDPKRVRIARWTVARCLRSLHRYNEALEIQRDLCNYPEAGYVSEEMGELLLATGDPEGAKPYFTTAYEKLSTDPWLKANEAERLERIKTLAGILQMPPSSD